MRCVLSCGCRGRNCFTLFLSRVYSKRGRIIIQQLAVASFSFVWQLVCTRTGAVASHRAFSAERSESCDFSQAREAKRVNCVLSGGVSRGDLQDRATVDGPSRVGPPGVLYAGGFPLGMPLGFPLGMPCEEDLRCSDGASRHHCSDPRLLPPLRPP